MSGFISSFLSKPSVQHALRLSKQANPEPSFNDDRPVYCRKTQDPPFLANNRGTNDKEEATMPDIAQSHLSDTHFRGDTDAGSRNDLATPPPILPGVQPQVGIHLNPGHSGYDIGNVALRSLDNIPETVPASSSSMLSQALQSSRHHSSLARDSSFQNAPQHSTNRTGIEEIDGQPLLPEDDGMGVLRKRIHAIRDRRLTSVEQARMIYNIMTENYNASRGILAGPLLPSSPPSSRSSERPGTSTSRWSGQSFDQFFSSSTSTAAVIEEDYNHTLTAEDLIPTFHPKLEPGSPSGDCEETETDDLEDLCFGCQHYKRNVKLQCYDCRKWYTCRFCHDEVEDHQLDRPKTENMLCMFCGHAQPAAQCCRECGEQAAQYYCIVCKLWDDDANKSIYHCNDCGICRIGKGLGKDFFHCKTCSVCLPISIETTHRCIERSTQCDCPICGDYMFTSPETVVFMRCGHSIHQRCLSEYSKSSYRCPICSKTITNMETTFRNLDRTIQSQPMPTEFKDTKALVYCNDCSAKSVVQYHWLGLRCDMCESYNTAQLRLLQGDTLDVSEQTGESGSHTASRIRSSSQGADESLAVFSGLSALQIDPSSAPGAGVDPRFSGPSSADANGQFSSYSLTRDRAVSPVISNYFGIPPDRKPERSKSTLFFGGQNPQDRGEDDAGEGQVHFWGTKFKYSYGFLGRGVEPLNSALVPEEEGGEDEEYTSGSTDSEDDDPAEEEEEEDDESIDIFGHR